MFYRKGANMSVLLIPSDKAISDCKCPNCDSFALRGGMWGGRSVITCRRCGNMYDYKRVQPKHEIEVETR